MIKGYVASAVSIVCLGVAVLHGAFGNNTKWVPVQIAAGQTLYQIAEKNYPNSDPRDMVYAIEKHNRITNIIQPGQTIEIPANN